MNSLRQHIDRISDTIVDGNYTIENGVVCGYKKIETGVVSVYKKIDDAFIDTFVRRYTETTEDARKRITEQRDFVLGGRR
jgi:hypothetical protein